MSHNPQQGNKAAVSKALLSVFNERFRICSESRRQTTFLMSFPGFCKQSKRPPSLPGIPGLRYPPVQAGRQSFFRNSASSRCPGSHSFQDKQEKKREKGNGRLTQFCGSSTKIKQQRLVHFKLWSTSYYRAQKPVSTLGNEPPISCRKQYLLTCGTNRTPAPPLFDLSQGRSPGGYRPSEMNVWR